ncbi:MAG: membrane integrity-associated transporter subunit PqiC, partial [Acidobacteriota bacterium]
MRSRRWLIVVWALILAAGCASAPPTHYYVLSAPSERLHGGSSKQDGLEIGIHAIDVAPPYDQSKIVYRIGRDAHEIGYYDYHRWAVPLSRMLPRVIATQLGQLQGVDTIEPARSDRTYDARIEGQLLTLEEIDVVDEQHVLLELRLTLVSHDGTELWSETLRGEGKTRTKDVADIVGLMSDVLS